MAEIIDLEMEDDDDIDEYMLEAAVQQSIREYEISSQQKKSNFSTTDDRFGVAGPSGFQPPTRVAENNVKPSFNPSQQVGYRDLIDGFDLEAGKTWIYPVNYSLRDYQFNIVKKGLFNNILVCLPTGLGKTFIAAVIMYNYYRWYPKGKVVFMAPTKPLVAQQIQACFQVMGIPQDDMVEMTGAMNPLDRIANWKSKRVFFLTPQVISNDLSRDICTAKDIRCLVIDEAHKALGNYAYVVVVKELANYTEDFRVVALSATPGSDGKAVQQVITNLRIAAVEIRTDESIDIIPYVHGRVIEKIVVPLSNEITIVRQSFMKIIASNVQRLSNRGVLWNRNPESLSKFALLKERDRFRQNPPERLQRSEFSNVEKQFGLCTTYYHCLELLQMHGLRSFYNFVQGIMDGQKSQPYARTELEKDHNFMELFNRMKQKFDPVLANPDEIVFSHPKLEKLLETVLQHFNSFRNSEPTDGNSVSTRVMIFAQYRDTVDEITKLLNQHGPLIKAMSFVGKAAGGAANKGISQKVQLQVVARFRTGQYNTLVSTCVGEEGLDIGDVDLIICYDAQKSPVRLVQRMGRTGRKRDGRIVMLITKGKEENIYNQGQYNKRNINRAVANCKGEYTLFQDNPPMIPRGCQPECHKMVLNAGDFKATTGKRAVEDKTTLRSLIKRMKKIESPFLSLEEYREWNRQFKVDPKQTKKLDLSSTMLSLSTQAGVNLSKLDAQHGTLSLTDWLSWQTTLQPSHLISHTSKSKLLVKIMQHLEMNALPMEANGLETSKNTDNSKLVTEINNDGPELEAEMIIDGPELGALVDTTMEELETNVNNNDRELENKICPVKSPSKRLISDFFQAKPKVTQSEVLKSTKKKSVPLINLESDDEDSGNHAAFVPNEISCVTDFFRYPKSVTDSQETKIANDSNLPNDLVDALKDWMHSIDLKEKEMSISDFEDSDDELFLLCDLPAVTNVSPILKSAVQNPQQTPEAVKRFMTQSKVLESPKDDASVHLNKTQPEKSCNMTKAGHNSETLLGMSELLDFVAQETPAQRSAKEQVPKYSKTSTENVTVINSPKPKANLTLRSFSTTPAPNFNLFLEHSDSDDGEVIPASPPNLNRPPLLNFKLNERPSLNVSPIRKFRPSQMEHVSPPLNVSLPVAPSHSTPKLSSKIKSKKLTTIQEDDGDESFCFRRKVRKANVGRCFIASQAEDVDRKSRGSDDELEADHYINDSFVEDEISHSVNETQMGVYLRSIKDPVKISRAFTTEPIAGPSRDRKRTEIVDDIFSQEPSSDVSKYEEDSFCVGDEIEFEESPEKTKKANTNKNSDPNKKWKRIKLASKDDSTMSHSSEDGKNAVNSVKKMQIEVEKPKCDSVINIFVSSREVSKASLIISNLRFKHKVNVHVRQISNCDYIVSNRVAVIRKSVSDVADTTARRLILFAMKEMAAVYDKPYLVIEDDRNKAKEHPKPMLHTIYFDFLLVQLSESSVTILFSRSQDATADILVDISGSEARKGHNFNSSVEPLRGKEGVFKIYCSLPNVSLCAALNFCDKFKTLRDFINSSSEEKVKKGSISVSKAKMIENYLRHRVSNFISS